MLVWTRKRTQHPSVFLLETGLKSTAPESIMNYIIEYLKQSRSNVVVSVIYDLIDFALSTKYADAKEQCKQIFIANKDEIDGENARIIREVYDEHVFD